LYSIALKKREREKMLQRKINRGVLAPLFHRIMDEKEGAVGVQFLNPEQLQESIVEDLSLILNTRCTVRKVVYKDHIQTLSLFGFPDFFGLGDFSHFDAADAGEWPTIALYLQTAIQAAEPRLREVYVKIDTFNAVDQKLCVSVTALLEEGKLLKEIHFPLEIQHALDNPLPLKGRPGA
jgi:type VI secretion system lysozyme-like protein